MWFRSLYDSFKSPGSRPAERRRGVKRLRKRAAITHLQFESLEDRSLLTTYAPTDLGTLGGSYSRVDDVNALGQVVGSSATVDGSVHAYIWTNGAMLALGTLGGSHSSATAVNDLGQVIGSADTPDGIGHAFRLNPEDTNGDGRPDRWFRDSNSDGANDLLTALPLPPWATASNALDINNSGEVVGTGVDADGHRRALLWNAAGVSDLDTFGSEYAIATGINDAGQVVGYTYDSPAQYRAFLWDGTHGTTDLGSPAGYGAAMAFGISPSGMVVGLATGSATGPNTGFLWTADQPNGVSGVMTTLHSPGAESSSALDVNDAGVVVGYSSYYVPPDPDSPYYPNGGSYITRASTWQKGVAEDLDMTVANAINAAGQIAGEYSYEDGSGYYSSAMLLTPYIPAPSLSISDVSVVEGNSGTVSAVFTVSLSAASDKNVTVNFATADGAATAGGDYQARSGTLTFAPGQTSKTFTVVATGDRLGEPNETFLVNLASATNATIADGQGVGTIQDDEPHISISDVTKYEGKKGQTTLFVFTVTLSAAFDQPVSMSFKTVNGTATTGNSDYIAKTGTLTFAPGETTKTITIEVKGDSKKEAHEYFYLDLFGNSSNSLFTKNRGVGTILNED